MNTIIPFTRSATEKEKAMSSAAILFEPCQVEYGGNRVRGMQITCPKCHLHARVVSNTAARGVPDEQVNNTLTRKFSEMGWQIGRTASRHLCPACIGKQPQLVVPKHIAAIDAAITPFEEKKPMKTSMTTTEAVRQAGYGGISKETLRAISAEAREMDRDDRRVIYDKLNDHYETAPQTGYRGGWNDARVARDLGVPVEWVAKVRDDLLGPDTNLMLAEQMAATQAGIAECREYLALLKEVKDHGEKVEAMLEKLTADIAALEQSMKAA
jgi:hypothetical protein